MSYVVRKKLEWWREAGEEKLLEQQAKKQLEKEQELKKRITEKFELKKGSTGKNPDAIMKNKPRPKKKLTKEQEKALLKKRLKELESELDDEEKLSLDDMEISVDKSNELPAETDDVQEVEVDEVHGGYCQCPKCGAKLSIELVDEDDGEEEEIEDEDMEDEDEDEDEDIDDTIEAEDRDISAKQLEKYYMRNRKQKRKNLGEETSEFGVEWGSATNDMRISGKPSTTDKMRDGEPESDSEDLDFGIDPQDTDDMVGPGRPMDGKKAITTDSNSRMPERQRKDKKRYRYVSEEEIQDPEESEIEANDILSDNIDDDEYADIPLLVGGSPDSVSRVKAVENRRRMRARQNESFKWSAYLDGKYRL